MMADGQTPVNPIPGLDMNSLNSMLGSMNVPNLAGMLNGINLNQIMPMIPSMLKMFGGSFGNLGGNPGGNPSGIPGGNPGYGIGYNGAYNNGYRNGYSPGYNNPLAASVNPGFLGGNPGAVPFVVPPHLMADPKFILLNTIRPMIPPDKAYIVDQIGRLLVIYVTITALLPKRTVPPAAPAAAPPVPAALPSET